MRHGLPAIVLAAATAVAIPSAQAPSSQQQRPTTFRTGTRLVQISVVVQDGQRRPVSGLTVEDFRLQDDGRDQTIALFSVETGRSEARAPDAVSPTTFTNLLSGPAAAGVTVILYDRLNTRQEHLQQARGHIVEFLKQLRPEDRVGFYVLESDSVRVLHDFTRDASSLLKALGRAPVSTSRELAGSEDTFPKPEPAGDPSLDAAMTEWLDRGEQAMQGFFQRQRVLAATSALEAIAGHLAGVRGRKNVIWISSGFPIIFNDGISPVNMSDEVYRATRALSHSDIAIYPVDARGLVGAFSTAPSVKQQQFTTLSSVMTNIETSKLIAEQTGGRAYYNTNDLGAAITRAVDDTRLTYVLGYYPTHDTWDGRFRKVNVSVRRRGVEVRHRYGYFAWPVTPAGSSTVESAFEALRSPLEATGVRLTARIDTAAAADQFTVALDVDGTAIGLVESRGLWEGTVDLVIAQALPDGRLYRSFETRVPLRLSAEERGRLIQDGLTLTRTISLRPDVHQLRVLVRDGVTGATGTLIMPADRVRSIRR
ncbi:MAG TPA: VWA domain-containing protein [Vicinamibacterales bacterium]|nr:VWA domain-containing protein [Vicinamibacterales bacterium]